MIKKVIVLITSLVIMFIGTSCSGGRIEAFLNTDLRTIMVARAQANKNLLNKLYVSGLISENERDTIIKNIDKQLEVYEGDISSNKEIQSRLLAAIVDWNVVNWEDYTPIKTIQTTDVDGNIIERVENSLGYTKEEWEEDIITNYILNNRDKLKDLTIPILNGEGSTIKPIELIDSETADLINNRFGYYIYVLKPFSAEDNMDTINSSQSLDEIIRAISEATSGEIDMSVLDRYFMPAVDENGNKVTLLDISKIENRVVADSRGSSRVSSTTYINNNGKIEKVTGNKVIDSLDGDGFKTPLDEPKPGKDMVVKDKTGKLPLFAIRFHEFNEDAIDNVISKLGMSPDKYVFATYGGENRVYIMEYPIYYISEIKNKEGNINEYICEFNKSNMGINLMTGKLIKYGSAWGNPQEVGVYMEDSDPYLPLEGAKNRQEEGKSAFVIEGETPEDHYIEVGENNVKVRVGRIILRDYLEAIYAPNVVDGENLVVFGRKIRFLRFNGNKEDVVARYYDKEGNLLDGSVPLYIDNFADFKSLNNENPIIRYIGRVNEVGSSSGDGDLSKVDGLDRIVVDSIKPTEQFPGIEIGHVDYDNTTKPLFYAVALKENMFNTGLFSSWINNEDTSKNSLVWWINWLQNPLRNYNYNINRNILEEYLIGNYSFELQESGIIVLNLATIGKIQKEYDEYNNKKQSQWFRTIFIVLGYFIICYSIILALAWVADTNVDLGINLLEKLTLGHWVAVKDGENIVGSDNKVYLTFGSMVYKVLGIATIGAILILVNVVNIVVYLIGIFGGISRYISKVIGI